MCFQVSRSFDMAIGEPEGRDAGCVGGLELDERRDQGLRRERTWGVAERQGTRLRCGEVDRVHVRNLQRAGEEQRGMQRADQAISTLHEIEQYHWRH